jgi:hypothetical protein
MHAPLGAHVAPQAGALVGRAVRKQFGARWWRGTVASTRFTRGSGRLWNVVYEDEDDEDLTWEELRSCLLPQAQAGAAAQPEHAQCVAAAAPALQQVQPVRAERNAPLQRTYKGVRREAGCCNFCMQLVLCGTQVFASGFADAEAAARAYDAAVRKQGIKVVNFPDADAGEVQAVRGESNAMTLKRLALGGAPAAAPPPPSVPRAAAAVRRRQQDAPSSAAPLADGYGALSMYDRLKLNARAAEPASDQAAAAPVEALRERQYIGVHQTSASSFYTDYRIDGVRVCLGSHPTPEAAARAHDAEARRRGKLHRLNFPATAAERTAVDTYERLGPRAWNAERNKRAPGAAAAAVPPSRKRSRSPGDGGAGKQRSIDAGGRKYPAGVHQSSDGVHFGARYRLPHSEGVLSLGSTYKCAEAAGQAYDAEVRVRGALHRLNYPATDEERAAVAEYRRLGQHAWNAQQRSSARCAAGAASPPERERSRSPGAQRGSRRKQGSAGDLQNGGGHKLAARRAAWRQDDRGDACPVQHANLEAFLRGIAPPLSKARALQMRGAHLSCALMRLLHALAGRSHRRCRAGERHHARAL